MPRDPLEQLLSGYRLPEVSRDLDHRVLRDGRAALARAGARAAMKDIGQTLVYRLGFGYLVWIIDIVTNTDAEYSVEFI